MKFLLFYKVLIMQMMGQQKKAKEVTRKVSTFYVYSQRGNISLRDNISSQNFPHKFLTLP